MNNYEAARYINILTSKLEATEEILRFPEFGEDELMSCIDRIIASKTRGSYIAFTAKDKLQNHGLKYTIEYMKNRREGLLKRIQEIANELG